MKIRLRWKYRSAKGGAETVFRSDEMSAAEGAKLPKISNGQNA